MKVVMEYEAQDRVDRWKARADYRSNVGRWRYWRHRLYHMVWLTPTEVVSEHRGDEKELWTGFRCKTCGETNWFKSSHEPRD